MRFYRSCVAFLMHHHHHPFKDSDEEPGEEEELKLKGYELPSVVESSS